MIKKILIFVLTCSLFLVCAKAKEKKKYLALGDSITAGYLLDNPEEESFASIFAKEYDFELTNEAVSGDKSGVLLEKLANYNIDNYDVITLCIGANDVLRDFIDKFEELDPAELALFIGNVKENEEFNKKIDQNLEVLDKNLEQIMNILKKGHAQIYMMNIYNPYRYNTISSMSDIADYYMTKINKVVEKYAKEVNFVNIYKTFAKTKNKIINSQDIKTIYDPHPNVEGHKLIAKTISESYYKNNPESINVILAIVLGVAVVILEVVEVIYTIKKFVVKPIIKDNDRPNIEEKDNNMSNSSRFIRS